MFRDGAAWGEWNVVRLGYRPGMDGIRAFLLIGVLAAHAGTRLRGTTVDVFFVLSGFLITSLLLEEWVNTTRIDLRAFYGRRAKRILPALFLAIGLTGVVYAVLPSTNRGWSFLTTALVVVFYSGNWVIAFAGSGIHDPIGLLNPTWSLAVEEQFYIVWPLVLVLCLGRRVRPHKLLVTLLGIAVASAAWRAFLWFVPHSRVPFGPYHFGTYYRSDARMDGLALGCALSIALATEGGRRLVSSITGKLWVACVASLFMVVVAWTSNIGQPWMYAVGWALVNVAGAILIAHCIFGERSPVTRFLSQKVFTWPGKRSYGAYLYHLPVFAVLSHSRIPLGVYPLFVVRFFVTLLLAAVSYRWVESYFLRRKRYPSREQTREPVEDVENVVETPAVSATPA